MCKYVAEWYLWKTCIHGKLHVLGDCIFHLKHSAGEVIITQVVMESGKAVVTRAEKLVALSRKVSGTLSF